MEEVIVSMKGEDLLVSISIKKTNIGRETENHFIKLFSIVKALLRQLE